MGSPHGLGVGDYGFATALDETGFINSLSMKPSMEIPKITIKIKLEKEKWKR